MKLLASLAILCLAFFQLSIPTRAHANAIPLEGDRGTSFYGMDDFGHVVFKVYNPITGRCGNPSVEYCYETETIDSNFSGFYSDTAPNLNWDFTAANAGGCGAPAPCTISDNGWTAIIAEGPIAGQALYGYYGSNPPQLLYFEGFAGVFAVNGEGVIVFDNGIFDLWEELSIPTTPSPEPSSIVLLATGILAFATFLYRRPAF